MSEKLTRSFNIAWNHGYQAALQKAIAEVKTFIGSDPIVRKLEKELVKITKEIEGNLDV